MSACVLKSNFISFVTLILFCFIKSSFLTVCGDKLFRLSPLHNDLNPVERPTKQVNVSGRAMCSTKCYNDVTCSGFFFRCDGRCSLFSTRFRSMSYVMDNGTNAYESFSGFPSDCYDVMLSINNISGAYTVVPRDSGAPINVYCETGGWLVIQRRTDGSEDFDRTWNEYRDGFGDWNNEFWLGNTNIYRITSQGYYELRIDMADFEGNTGYALYKDFSVSSESDYFRLSLSTYSGDAGDSLTSVNGQRFSAKDLDRDSAFLVNCAKVNKGAWWYRTCHESNLNGQYLGGADTSKARGVEWRTWKGVGRSLKTTVMKIRPMQF